MNPPAVAYAVLWTTQRDGKGETLDAGIYSEPTPTRALDGRDGYAFVIGYARSSRGYEAARAKVFLNLQRCGIFDTFARYPSFRAATINHPARDGSAAAPPRPGSARAPHETRGGERHGH